MIAGVVRVRPARREDGEAIEALETAVFGRASITAAVDRGGSPTDPRCWVAVVDDQVRGFLSAVVAIDEIEIQDVAVAPDCRRRGIALELVRQVLRDAARSGVRRAVLEVGERNDAGRALYGRCGFRRCGRRKGYYRGGAEDAWILESTLP